MIAKSFNFLYLLWLKSRQYSLKGYLSNKIHNCNEYETFSFISKVILGMKKPSSSLFKVWKVRKEMSCLGRVVGYSVISICKGCRLDPCSEAAHECINEWNSRNDVSLCPFLSLSLKSVNKFFFKKEMICLLWKMP